MSAGKEQGAFGDASLVVLQVNYEVSLVVELELEQGLNILHNICISYSLDSVKNLKMKSFITICLYFRQIYKVTCGTV